MRKQLPILKYSFYAACFIFFMQSSMATTYYVNASRPDNTGDGLSWASAYKDLQFAIDATVAWDTIWMASGTYLPTEFPPYVDGSGSPLTLTDNRMKSFYSDKNLTILGGFPSSGNPGMGLRDPYSNVTILSGDTGVVGDSTDNFYHVYVLYDSGLELNGISVTGGFGKTYSTSSPNPYLGATSASASEGAGLFAIDADVAILGCRFYKNYTIKNVYYKRGGACSFKNTSAYIANSEFYQNQAGNGGAILLDITPAPAALTSGNHGAKSMAMSPAPKKLSIRRCEFFNNQAIGSSGGAIDVLQGPMEVRHSIFYGNSSNGISGYGGAVRSITPSSFFNSVFYDNTASSDGGAIYLGSSSRGSEVINCTIYNNSITSNGSGYGIDSEPGTGGNVFVNNVCYDNKQPFAALSRRNFGLTDGDTIMYCVINSNDDNYTGEGVINYLGSNLFVNANDPDGPDDIWGTADDGLALSKCSPALDAAINDSIPSGPLSAYDVTGSARIANTTADIGAYERPASADNSPKVYYVNANQVDDTGDALSWTSAAKNIQTAINFACAGDTIFVATGEYEPTENLVGSINFTERVIHIQDKDIVILGGFPETGNPTLADRDWRAFPTSFSGQGNKQHVLLTFGLTSSTVIDGFIIKKGRSSYIDGTRSYRGLDLRGNSGAGMINFGNSSPKVRNCIFYDNNSGADGGAIYNDDASPILENVAFIENSTRRSGGAVYNKNSSPEITNALFYKNTTTETGGGAIWNSKSMPQVTNATFVGNRGYSAGTIYEADTSQSSYTNCIFYDNSVINNFFNNRVDLAVGSQSTATITYSSMSLAEADYNSSNFNVITNGTGNIYNMDPLFLDLSSPIGVDSVWLTADDGLTLTGFSPAIDGGNSSAVPTGITMDIIDSMRIKDNAVDMGAYEGDKAPCAPTAATDSLVACDSLTWIDGITYTASNTTAMDTLVNAGGCDSVVTLNLTIKYSTTSTDVQSAYNSYNWIDGNTYTVTSDTATYTVTNAVGCDSIITLDLTILDCLPPTSVTSSSLNDSTEVVGWTSNGTEPGWLIIYGEDGFDPITSGDSLMTTNAFIALENLEECVVYDVYVSQNCAPGVYSPLSTKHSFTKVGMPTGSTETYAQCDSFTWRDGNTYYASTTSPFITLTNAVGCDSTITLNLTIYNSDYVTDVQSANGSYTWIDGSTYTSSNNTATYSTTNSNGCDSIITLDLTILPCEAPSSITSTSINDTTEMLSWTAAGTEIGYRVIYGVSGFNPYASGDTVSTTTTSVTLTNLDECTTYDVYVISDCGAGIFSNNLPILSRSATIDGFYRFTKVGVPTRSTDVQVACDSYTWIDGITYTSSNNTATYVTTNAAGCDSTITLDLTINNSTTGTDYVCSCDSFTWIDGMTYYSDNNTATYMLSTIYGCDSLVTLDLTIKQDTVVYVDAIGIDSFVSPSGNYTWTNSGIYTDVVTSSCGCDSTLIIDLTIGFSLVNHSIEGPSVVCEGDIVPYQIDVFTLNNISGYEWVSDPQSLPNTDPDLYNMDFTGVTGMTTIDFYATNNSGIIFGTDKDVMVLDAATCATYSCEPYIHVSSQDLMSQIVPWLVKMQQYITSDGKIEEGSIQVFEAGDHIELQPGFEVELGAEFEAKIENCNPSLDGATDDRNK